MPSYSNINPIFQSEKVKPDDFEYDLPDSRIAEYPAEPRDSARLMVINKDAGYREHKNFADITDYLEEGDVLVLNNTQVFPAKFTAYKDDTNDPIHVFLLRELGEYIWEVSVDPARKVRIGNSLIFGENLKCDVIDNTVSSGRVISFHKNGSDLQQTLGQLGEAPLPPYIHRRAEPKDKVTYQTVYAASRGSVVAPSAGLHFTETLLEALEAKGVRIVKITLHLGVHPYEPITISDLSKFSLNAEYFNISKEAASVINSARNAGERVIAVGASTMRALETSQFEGKKIVPREGWTDLFIYPPFHFHIADGLITNFHQPLSATMILQSAFYHYEGLMESYHEALSKDYRFLSYGDAMMML